MSEQITSAVRAKYGQTARSGLSSQRGGIEAVAKAFGYSAEELAAIPAEANMGLSCGNPVATANLREGETVVDLGSGGGLDVFLAARKVGPAGRAIGIDMTPEMIELANRNARNGPDGKPYANVQFLLGSIDAMPLRDATADIIISNCVINLAPDKDAVFREMFRVLKPGGRVAVSDIALKQPLPPALADSIAAMVGCIAGAIPVEQYQSGLAAAGFQHVAVVETGADLNAYALAEGQSGCCSAPQPPSATQRTRTSDLAVIDAGGCCSTAPSSDALHAELAQLLTEYDVNAYAAAVRVFAIKPAASA